MLTTKKLLFLALMSLNHALKLMAMQHMSTQDIAIMHNCIGHIELARDKGESSGFRNSGLTAYDYIDQHIKIIEAILNKYSIAHPRTQEKTRGWLKSLKNQLITATQIQDPAVSTIVDISGLDKAAVIQALFDAAIHEKATSLSEAELFQALANLSSIDYVASRSLKVDLSEDTFNCFLYDRDNGAGAARIAIAKLRARMRF